MRTLLWKACIAKGESRLNRRPAVWILSALIFACVGAAPASASAIRSLGGFNANTLAANDDGSTLQIPLPFSLNFFGATFNSLHVNNNGNVTFDNSLSTYTPFDLNATNRQIIAPFFADVDTRNASSGRVHYGTDTVDGHPAFGVEWPAVGYYFIAADKLNTFELALINRADTGNPDNFDIEFNYGQMQWDTGAASGGSGGLCTATSGDPARVGYANGTGLPGTHFELPGSAVCGAFLDGGVDALVSNSLNSNVLGRYVFESRNGEISTVPEPATLSLFAVGLAGLLGAARRRFGRA